MLINKTTITFCACLFTLHLPTTILLIRKDDELNMMDFSLNNLETYVGENVVSNGRSGFKPLEHKYIWHSSG